MVIHYYHKILVKMKKYIFSIVCACIVLITIVSCQKTNGKITGNTTKTAANEVSKNNIENVPVKVDTAEEVATKDTAKECYAYLSKTEYENLQAKLNIIFQKDAACGTPTHTVLYKDLCKAMKPYVETVFSKEVDQTKFEPYELEYYKDTLRIRVINNFCQSKDFSTFRMQQCGAFREEAENALLKKYYQKALSHLKPEDKNLLIRSQQLWKKSLQSDQTLSNTITSDKYTGGGTMWVLIDFSDKMPRIQFVYDCFAQVTF